MDEHDGWVAVRPVDLDVQGDAVVGGVDRGQHGQVKSSYIALLRAVNVGGRTLKMDRLRSELADLGLGDVRTYVQSGNVLFSTARSRSAVAKQLEDRLGVRVLLRTRDELASIVAGRPFPDTTKLHVTFLDARPGGDGLRDLAAASFAPEEFRAAGTELYVYCPNGYGRAKLNNGFLERKLRVTATTRNWRTVTTLLELLSG